MEIQALPFGDALTIDAGIEDAVKRMLTRRRSRPHWYARAIEEDRQLKIKFPAPHINRKNGRPCKYSFELIEYARKLRGYGFAYREISEELAFKFRQKVPLFTVRDWVQHWTRVSG